KQTPFFGWGGGCRVEAMAVAAGETSGGGGVAWSRCGVAVEMVGGDVRWCRVKGMW
nr:hypothetical protein [Tanacetum cinerariifolium]